MYRNRFIALILFALLALPPLAHAEQFNVGFVEGLWFATDPVFANEPTRIYVAFRNNTAHDLTGTVRFTDNGTRIGSTYITALAGRLVEAWIDWTPNVGAHTLGAALTDVEVHELGKSTRSITIGNATVERTLTIDIDTDYDGVGNAIDTDDDNDGASDEEEGALGTNPLRVDQKAEPTGTEEASTSPDISEEPPHAPMDTVSPKTESAREGLERYFDDGVVGGTLGKMTDAVLDTQAALDRYRAGRESQLHSKQVPEVSGSTTITRTKIQTEKNFFESVFSWFGYIFSGAWSFFLVLISAMLSYPAFVELVILVLLLYLVYRTARRFGRRPN